MARRTNACLSGVKRSTARNPAFRNLPSGGFGGAYAGFQAQAQGYPAQPGYGGYPAPPTTGTVVDQLRFQSEPDQLFADARRTVTWHYQWIVVHDFLARLVGPDVLGEVLVTAKKTGRASA